MKKVLSLLTTCILSVFLVAQAEATISSDDPEILFKDGKFFGEIRYRYEGVQQNNALSDANANTIRTNIGFKTGNYKGFEGLIEGQLVRHLGDEDFNSLDNGQTTFSTVADPDTAQLNRAWVSFSGIPDTTIKYGRQAINLDNQRFVGTVGWRQNDQTFDAATVENNSFENLTLRYSHLSNVNRIFGGPTPADDLDSSTHLANAAYDFAEWLNVTAYGYWMEFDNAAGLSNQTFGVRAKGEAKISDGWSVTYEAEAATQEDYKNNTASYDEDYYHIAPGIKGHGLSLKLGYEVLGGNGTNAFQTPLATLHKFNGWSDQFLNTPAAGLKDFYVAGAYKVSGTGTVLDGTKLKAAWHDFEGDTSGDFGSELNLAIAKSFKLPENGQPFDKLNVLLKYADYNAEDAPFVDTEKVWLQLGVKF